ncbi:MAG: hypothetical protein IKD79_01250, partial [Oscillospiraceae bacterium]|nr:hypothetical protein [Oscillospiraceae bacterium]
AEEEAEPAEEEAETAEEEAETTEEEAEAAEEEAEPAEEEAEPAEEADWADYQEYLIEAAGSNAPDQEEFKNQVYALTGWEDIDLTTPPWDQLFTTVGLSTWEAFQGGERNEAAVSGMDPTAEMGGSGEPAPSTEPAPDAGSASNEPAPSGEPAPEAGDASNEPAPSGEPAPEAGDASNEPAPSGEPSGPMPSEFDCDILINGETVSAHYEDTATSDPSVKNFQITVGDRVITGTIDTGDWVAENRADQPIVDQVKTAFEAAFSAGPASGEPSAEAGEGLSDGGWPLTGSGDISLDAFKKYLKAYMDCVPEMDGHEEELYGLIDAESWGAPVSMAWESWFEENAMTYDEFVAANGEYSLHLFNMTNPPA